MSTVWTAGVAFVALGLRQLLGLQTPTVNGVVTHESAGRSPTGRWNPVRYSESPRRIQRRASTPSRRSLAMVSCATAARL